MKTICVPKDSIAQTHLDFDESQPGELIELSMEDETVNQLLMLGFFDSINKLTHSNIDNFEDESITAKHQLMKVLDSNLFDKKSYDQELHQVIDDIKDLFNMAIASSTGVYFYF
ncbi:hypothetical protein [Pedobacter sp.]|jgi:hypothetical protein|uniref:hypothetical protein n=1 Tax=Pedobacter sp. TaxID=1411316 RepID=UPI002C8C0FDC|nr:hypothetical protein [Pedobacter sp.]HWW43096.1 hypothetical protein [Pedobacter sp.]